MVTVLWVYANEILQKYLLRTEAPFVCFSGNKSFTRRQPSSNGEENVSHDFTHKAGNKQFFAASNSKLHCILRSLCWNAHLPIHNVVQFIEKCSYFRKPLMEMSKCGLLSCKLQTEPSFLQRFVSFLCHHAPWSCLPCSNSFMLLWLL